ncbi:HEAT repeat [Saccharicrinis carchari]|uniref:HEAT repeat n=1 Tax=Saccharicrinis carchari TaxID=1168039 RepID=A0A521EA50_SACCC|nr:family 16 glycoside hydrolase [Saccharicrinis carchari]SMO80806.1 HEAT repeat [Saccharicrinis carchari]
MKQTFILILLSLFVLTGTQAQHAKNRSVSTVIADALAQLPADKQDKYKHTIQDLMATGEEGILNLVSRMQPPGAESNEAIEFALSGWTHNASMDESQRSLTEKAYLKALETTDVPETLAFIIRQLERIGQEESITPLTAYLQNESLSNPAAQALAAMSNPKADAALLSSLQRTKTEAIRITLVNTIGQRGYKKAEPVLLSMLKAAPSMQLEGALLMALGQTGSKASLKTLRKNAEKAGFGYDKTGATNAYVALLNRLAGQGESKTAAKEAGRLLTKATALNKQELRIAALNILMASPQSNTDVLLSKALNDAHLDYVTKALSFYINNGGHNNQLILDRLPSANPIAKTAILYWLGNQRLEAGIPAVVNALNNNDKNIQKAAISSAEKLGGPQILEGLTQLLQSNDREVISLAKEALSTYKGNMAPSLGKAFPQVGQAGKVAILQLLASRRSADQYNLVRSQLTADDTALRLAAFEALPYVVSAQNLDELFGMLESSDTPNRAAIQKAINIALSSQSPEEQLKKIQAQMENNSEKKHLYYAMLAHTGAKGALDLLMNDYSSASGESKAAVFEAFTQWPDFEAIHPLLSIARNSDESTEVIKAVDAIVNLISRSQQTGEVRTIFLREALQLAKTDRQKKEILKLLGNTGTFQALLSLEQYLDNTDLMETAAQAVMNIALNNKAYAGSVATRMLNKVSTVLNNPDAGYQRQAIKKYLDENPNQGGYVSMFNGKNLDGWQGLVGNPLTRAKMSKKELAVKQIIANKAMTKNWSVKDGTIVFDGKGANLCSVKKYGDFEMLVDWRITKGGDSGIYLRGSPQVQIWDTALVEVGAQVGSGGLYNNQKHPSIPLKVADNRVGEWNSFYIKMIGEKVTVILNGELVVDNVTMENYWDRKQPIFPIEAIELQAHGNELAFRDIYVREINTVTYAMTEEEEQEGFTALFDGSNLNHWTGNTTDYIIEEGNIVIRPSKGSGGNLYTKKEYDDFVFRFEFQLTPGANNGLGIRTPMEGDAAYVGMELQILDNTAPIYAELDDFQYHASVYGIIPAKRGYLKPVGEWNTQEVIANGDHIKITLNGTVILNGNLREATKNGTADGKEHPGLFNKKGHIGFLGHGSVVKFRNIRIKEL